MDFYYSAIDQNEIEYNSLIEHIKELNTFKCGIR